MITETPRQKDNEPAFVGTMILNRHLPRYENHDAESLSRKLLVEMAALEFSFNPPTNLNIINKAISLAGNAHKEKKQIRIFTGDEYLVHPLRTAFLAIDLAKALKLPVTTELVVSAMLHDVPEDNENYTREVIQRAFQQFDSEKPGISNSIANDAAAFDHNDPKRATRLTSEQYRDKLIDTKDTSTLFVRILVKIADRLDNLLDPPLPSERSTVSLEEYVKKRQDFIQRTEDPTALISLLLLEWSKLNIAASTNDDLLENVINSFVSKSKQTLRHGLNPDK